MKGTKFLVGSEALQMCAFSSCEGAGNFKLPKFRMAACRFQEEAKGGTGNQWEDNKIPWNVVAVQNR